jgi:hypothetical protein
MPTYFPTDSPSDITCLAYCRQNCFKNNQDKDRDVLEIVKTSNKLHCPWAHTKQSVDDYLASPEGFRENNSGYSHSSFIDLFLSLNVGDLVLVPNGNNELIVRIDSATKAGIMPGIALAREPTNCGHPYLRHQHATKTHSRCDVCSVVGVFPSNSGKLQQYLMSGKNIEPFYSVYRDVTIVGEADYNGINGATMAAPNSAGRKVTHWRLDH